MGILYAGTGRQVITPTLGCHIVGYFEDRVADHIHDELYVKALALRSGDVRLGLITCDLIDLPTGVVVAAKAAIAARTGVPPTHVLISCTHTHTAPSAVGALGTPADEAYAQSLIPRIADAYVMALAQLRPAELAHVSGNCREEVHNRRWHMKDGRVVMNPGHLNPDAVCPAGPTDPELGLLIVREAQTRRPLAVYGNLALHYVGSERHTWISADYFGEFAKALQRLAGAEFLVLLANGCQGNINNLDFARPERQSIHPYEQQERVGNVVAAEAWKQWNILRESDFTADVTLDAELVLLDFKARQASAAERAAAQALYSQPTAPQDAEWIYAREVVLLSAAPSEWRVPVQALRVGTLGIAGLHGEVFVEVGLDIKARSPLARTMVVGLANGSIGYVATDQALAEGSYETRLCRHVRAPMGTAALWADTAAAALSALAQRVPDCAHPTREG
jgi:hypothetical protein